MPDRSPPVVSVFMPTYNYGEFIERAIASVLAQTFRDLELVVSDNASDDGTEEICRRFAAADPRVRYHRNPENLGLSANFNLAVERCSPGSSYLIGLPADDWWEPDLLETLVREARAHPGVAVVYSDLYRVEKDGRIINRYSDLFRHVPAAGRHRDVESLLRNNYIPFQAALVDRGRLASLLPDRFPLFGTEVPHVNDYDLWMHLMLAGGEVCYVPRPLASMRKHERAETMPQRLVPRLRQEVLVFERSRSSCPEEYLALHREEHANRLARCAFQLLQAQEFEEAIEVLDRVRENARRRRRDVLAARFIAALPLSTDLRSALWRWTIRLAPRRAVPLGAGGSEGT